METHKLNPYSEVLRGWAEKTLAWHNVSHTQCGKCLLTLASPDIWPFQWYNNHQPPPPLAPIWNHMEKWPRPPRLKVPLQPVCSFCPQCHKGDTAISLKDHGIPGIAESSLRVTCPPASVFLHPSSSVWSQTELLLRLTDTDCLADGKTDELACRQIDTQSVLYIRAWLLLWVSIYDHKLCALDEVPFALQWPSCQCSLSVCTPWLQGGQSQWPPIHTDISLTGASVARVRGQQQVGLVFVL